MAKTDRRVQRTRALLQKTLIELIRERGYDAVTIQDIADRADVGRTTFYLHYGSKDELFVTCHEAVVSAFHFGPNPLLSRQEMMAPDAPPGMVSACRHLKDARALLHPVFQGKESQLILRQIRDRSARDIEASLRAAFAESDSSIPFDVLANYLARARIALVEWLLEMRLPYAPEDLAQTFHRLQRAAIRDALGIGEGE